METGRAILFEISGERFVCAGHCLLCRAGLCFDINPFINRLIVYGLAVLWILWLVARHMVKLFLLLLFAGVLLYGWNWYATREIRKCEESGKVWNKETKACEEKKTIMQRIELLLNKYLPLSESQKHE